MGVWRKNCVGRHRGTYREGVTSRVGGVSLGGARLGTVLRCKGSSMMLGEAEGETGRSGK